MREKLKINLLLNVQCSFCNQKKKLLFGLYLFIEEERMPSFDIVSEVDLHEVRNAVENAQRDTDYSLGFS